MMVLVSDLHSTPFFARRVESSRRLPYQSPHPLSSLRAPRRSAGPALYLRMPGALVPLRPGPSPLARLGRRPHGFPIISSGREAEESTPPRYSLGARRITARAGSSPGSPSARPPSASSPKAPTAPPPPSGSSTPSAPPLSSARGAGLHPEIAAASSGEAPSPAVLDPLVEAIRENDQGRFSPAAKPAESARDKPRAAEPRRLPSTSKRNPSAGS